ncbi:MAG: hypothetical protein HYY37_00550 [Candidatus Aenigmarchaeota archaeon]|nr:hypothetical protein [Candidatus Aenigmarchaeota archaeon]
MRMLKRYGAMIDAMFHEAGYAANDGVHQTPTCMAFGKETSCTVRLVELRDTEGGIVVEYTLDTEWGADTLRPSRMHTVASNSALLQQLWNVQQACESYFQQEERRIA